jgi:hypothetical protein
MGMILLGAVCRATGHKNLFAILADIAKKYVKKKVNIRPQP